MSHLFFYLSVIVAIPAFSQKIWDGGAGNNEWNDPLNWNNNTTPSSADDVVLDHTFIVGNYIVILPADPVTVKNIFIDPAPGSTIELILPEENKAIPGLTISGPGYGLIINRGGIFRNSSGAPSGAPLSVSDSIRINNDGRFIINTPRAHAANIDVLSRAPGTEKGIVEFDIPDAATTISLSGKTYGKLVLKADAFGHSLNYTAAGTSKVVIRSDLEIGDSVNMNLNFSDSILVKGDLIQGAAILNLGSTARSVVLGIGGNISLPAGGQITETGTGIQQILLNGDAEQQLNIHGLIVNQVALVKNSVSHARLLSKLLLPHALNLIKGNIISSNTSLLVLQSGCIVIADSLSDESFIDGPVKKEGLSVSEFMFPIGKSAKMRWVQLVSATGDFTVEYFNESPRLVNNTLGSGVDHISGMEYWSMSGGSSAIVKLSFFDPNSGGVTALSQLRVAQLQSGVWQNAGNTNFGGTPGTNGWVSSSAASGFSAENHLFALASAIGQENPLPVFFRQFNVTTYPGKTIFKWQVDKYHSAVAFDIQESSDNHHYQTIYSCSAIEATTDYYYQTARTETTKRYYRIRAIDKDAVTYYLSKIFFVNGNTISAMNTLNVTSFLNLRIMMTASRRVEFVIYNMNGSPQKKIQMDVQKGLVDLQIMVSDLPAGNYICSMLAGHERMASFKFVRL